MAATKKTSPSTTRKTTAKKSSGSGTTRSRKSASAEGNGSSGTGRSRSGSSAPRASAPKRMSGMQVAREAAAQLLELTGREVEGITSLQRTDDGWKVEVEVVEVRRIPDTTDVLAIYEIEADGEGNVEGYRRLHRYARGSAESDR